MATATAGMPVTGALAGHAVTANWGLPIGVGWVLFPDSGAPVHLWLAE